MQAAMVDTAVCYSILAFSASTDGVRNGGSERNVAALSFCGDAMRALRERLVEESQSPRDETILAATTLWNVSAVFEDRVAVESHGNAIQGLVAARGGLARLGIGGILAELIKYIEIFSAVVLKKDTYVSIQLDPGSLQDGPHAIYG